MSLPFLVTIPFMLREVYEQSCSFCAISMLHVSESMPRCLFYMNYRYPSPSLNPAEVNSQILTSMEAICKNTGAEIILHPQYIEICGHRTLVKKAYEQMISTDYFKVVDNLIL